MPAISLGALALISAITAVIGGTASIASSAINAKNVEETNKQNIEAQNAINAQSQYNMEHAHQIEMADLKAAGLNPVLTATGGSGAPMASLNAPKAQAPQVDLSGISSAMSSMTNMMLTAYILDQKTGAYNNRTDMLRDVKSRTNNFSHVSNANQVKKASSKLTRKEIKEFKSIVAELEAMNH